MFRSVVVPALLATVLGCATEPSAAPAVTLTLAVSPANVAPGEPVHFTLTISNLTDTRIEIGGTCGPSLDVDLRGPAGWHSTIWHERLGPNGGFTCQSLPEHFLDAHESRTESLDWVPRVPGSYSAAGGFRHVDGLAHLTKTTTFQVW